MTVQVVNIQFRFYSNSFENYFLLPNESVPFTEQFYKKEQTVFIQ